MEFRGITRECDRLWSEGAMALVGISPFNSYFSTERIQSIIDFCEDGGRAVALFVPDDVTRFTLQARGYTKDEAVRKTSRQMRYLRNKMNQAMGARRLAILGCESLATNAAYQNRLAEALDRFETDDVFRRRCLDTTRWVLSAKDGEPVGLDAAMLGVQYLLAELPLFFHASEMIGSDVVFVYHQCPLLISETYQGELAGKVSRGQGFGVLRPHELAGEAAEQLQTHALQVPCPNRCR
ncbi:tRNA-dependent cyclodipeptide synthase [Pseudoxanthomonas sp. SE1]|uniref:tRNA-dependent cyclodipeptide synthase n=1 Tax=Pseudoxanthomonas sp. SE1 TaxID=1664560 RepID=UPI00240E626A|nr:tRNA-dependent cyclodipeptide synthase [Pseudoxanthomonas sp. SE1]WFC40262.1 tRNA-dependent cyclodipeptide synthase [Pseudoxanthomonas sp. SE1]WFC43735.1 tRNA-dependent cyclodipeptide synthase [Pseudoxanthomonas sp. SE1]